MKLKEIKEFKGVLKVLEGGLRIGGSRETEEIGGTDNPIIRHPISREPYVPGSSIKGKIRSLLEARDGKDEPCSCGNCEICQLFGCGNAKNTKSPTRLAFRDCQATDETHQRWINANVDPEIKYEVMIDRKKGTAAGSGPRKMERIPAGSDFDFSFSLRIYENDKVEDYYRLLADGFELLEKHYLGGCGSRGYGKVKIVAEDGKMTMAEYLRSLANSSKKQ